MYVPNDDDGNGEDDDDISFDHDDDMSEDDVLGLARTDEVEQPLDVSSGEDGGVKGKKKERRLQLQDAPRIQRLGNILRR
jgi:hypothetical protein